MKNTITIILCVATLSLSACAPGGFTSWFQSHETQSEIATAQKTLFDYFFAFFMNQAPKLGVGRGHNPAFVKRSGITKAQQKAPHLSYIKLKQIADVQYAKAQAQAAAGAHRQQADQP